MSPIRKSIAISAGKLAAKSSALLGKGTGEQIFGRVVDALDPKALKSLAQNKRGIAVSSTNGKTTTTRLVSESFQKKYSNVLTNALGANQRAGLIAALANFEATSETEDTFAILEVDERSLPGLFNEINPELLIFGNLSRDQLDRFGEVSSISKSWRKMLAGSSAKVIANGNDPHIVFALSDLNEQKVIYVDTKSKWHDDANTCPKCGELLAWDKQSHFNSPTCGFSTPKNLEKSSVELLDKVASSLNIPGNWNVNNALLALWASRQYDISDDEIFESWKKVVEVSGRNAVFSLLGNKTVQLYLAKNPAGWNETLTHISKDETAKTIFAFNCNIADGKDPSWLYDVDFETTPLNEVIVFGERNLDMTLRLEIAGKKVIRAESISEALEKCPENSHTNIVASYTQFLKLSRTLPKMRSIDNSSSQGKAK